MPRYKYSNEDLQKAVSISSGYRQTLVALGLRPSGGMHRHLKHRIKELDLDISHFKGKSGLPATGNKKKTAEQILVHRPGSGVRQKAYNLRRALIESGVCYRCAICGLGDIWNNKPLTLQVDHIDGNWENDRRENLQFVCPNCHTQTTTFSRVSSRCVDCKKAISKRATRCNRCASITRTQPDRKVVNRPSLEVLINQIDEKGVEATARGYGVTGNAVRNWVKTESYRLEHATVRKKNKS